MKVTQQHLEQFEEEDLQPAIQVYEASSGEMWLKEPAG